MGLEMLGIYLICLVVAGWSSHKIGLREGYVYAVEYMEAEGLIELDEEKSNEKKS